MIFVALGTGQWPFVRLVKWLDKAIAEGKINEKIVVQAGPTIKAYQPKSELIKMQEFMPHDQIDQYFRTADKIIIHAGIGFFLQVMDNNKVPILVPRDPKQNELIDNHQWDTAVALQEQFNVPYAETYEELLQLLQNNPRQIKVKSHRKELISFLDEFVSR